VSLERLVVEAMAMAAHADGAGPELADLVNRYWRLVPDADLGGRTPARLLAETSRHLELAQQRLIGELKLDVFRDGDHTSVLVVTDDMPFLVDSVTAAASFAGYEVSLLVHPQVVVRREALGALSQVLSTVDPDSAGPGDVVESWMRVEVPMLHDPSAVTELRDEIQRVLTDVRETVEDWQKMRSQALSIADELATDHLPVPDKDISDSVDLLRWLAEDHFTFLGYREYRIVTQPDGKQALEAVLGTGLGILRRDPVGPRILASMSPEAYQRVQEKRLLIITKANSRSTVHRSAFLDYVSLKVFDDQGTVVGERRFLGLFSAGAYQTSVRDLPVIKRKVQEVMNRSGLSPRGHSGKNLMSILEDYPREELFQITTDDLFRTVMGVLRLAGRRQVKLFARKDQYGRFVSCLVFLPRDRFTTENRLRMQDILLRELKGVGVDYTTRVTDATLARIHFIVRVDPTAHIGQIDTEAISTELADATRLWEDDFQLALQQQLGEHEGRRLLGRYRDALPETYKDTHSAAEAVQDIAMLEMLDEPGELALHLYQHEPDGPDVRFKVFRFGDPMTLSDVLPVLHSLGVGVKDERPYEVRRRGGSIHIYDFGLTLPAGAMELSDVRAKVENAFCAAWRNESEVDGFNELVLRSGLTWRQVVVLRAYAKYLRQAGTVYSQEYMETTLAAHPDIAAKLLALFEARLDPASGLTLEQRGASATTLAKKIRTALDEVGSLDQDRILRSYLALIEATLRTSFFQRSDDARPKPYVAFKLDPMGVPDLPEPRPRFEIFVYSPRFEGVHLRFGPVARGGLRWSDRREDFRTEILGLVKAQTVKNAIIVPVGAKGGFVVKSAAARSAVTTVPDRDAVLAEGVSCYRQFISAMLDITDNLIGGQVVPPSNVVRHDGDDPYLVVAADKGTATFSDIANEISASYGFWLGDAFASGGSAGYDHKKMGITARGAWESVKRHGRDMGLDTQSRDFTVVGVGDMSGDVFGNAMLLSEHIKLVAAFDHRHIFVDPDPDPATSYVERQRLFDLPRSSWYDFDRDLLSPGGGVWPRTAKSIPVSGPMRDALGIADETVTALAPADLLKAILLAPVDLFFNGGIGTYVKAHTEFHAEVGDKANDAIRVNGSELRARIIGEGGNLGLTQRGRIEYAQLGGSPVDGVRHAHVGTDFIDNSAGVDTSDHEVNMKILLGAAEQAGQLTRAERDDLLASTTDEVAQLVLRDNYEQNTTLGNARVQARSLLSVHRRMITEMERAGHLDRELEALPTDEEIEARTAAGVGLTSPELAVLLAYTKILNEREIVDSSLPDDDWTEQVLVDYFPTPLRERFRDRMAAHRLRREIITTGVVNQAVNRGGVSFLFRAMEETGATPAEVVRAFIIVRDVYGLSDLWQRIEALDSVVPTSMQTVLFLELRRLMDRAARRLVMSRGSLDVTAEIDALRPGVRALLPRLDDLLQGRERDAVRDHIAGLVARGIPADLAADCTHVTYSFGLLDIVEVAADTRRDLDDVAGVYFVLSDRFSIDDLLSRISALPRDDRWQSLARMALRYDLYAALAALTRNVLADADPDEPPARQVQRWEAAHIAAITRTRNAMGEFDESRADLAALSVLLRQVRTLVQTSATQTSGTVAPN
jgi:glutamate dehydrogenase